MSRADLVEAERCLASEGEPISHAECLLIVGELAALRSEVERLKARIAHVLARLSDESMEAEDYSPVDDLRAALDSSTPAPRPHPMTGTELNHYDATHAPRMFTEEQVREYGERVREAAASSLVPKADSSIAARVLIAFCQGVIRRLDLKALLEAK
jgi:hypothetical protein